MHIVHGLAGIARSAGGTSTFVVGLANAHAAIADATVSLITTAATADDLTVAPAVSVHRVRRLNQFAEAVRAIHARAPIDVIHAHGLWQWSSHVLGTAARSLGVNFVLSPHGMLEPSAFSMKAWRKRLAMIAYQRADIERADALHATADLEAANLRRRRFRQPIVVAPPGIRLPPQEAMRHWGPADSRRALILSRIHPQKNLLGLLSAWATCRPPAWTLVVAGPDSDGHADVVRTHIDALGLADTVSVQGPRYDDEKAALFRSASLVILPSFSENFGIVVAEALSYGVPVITTTGTPWRCVVDEGCGWHVPSDEASLTACLATATACPDTVLRAMGQAGRALVEQRFEWSRIAADVDASYRWLLGRGPKPGCVA